MNLISFPKAQSVVVSGDIHGDFTQLVFKVCVQYDMYDTLVIVAGDCGFGFEKEAYYEQVFRRVQKRLTAHNCWIVMMRGNHDDPSYFSESKISHERFQTIPDYTIIEAIGQHILCVGGAISMDRTYRKALMLHHPNKMYYWSNEAPIYDENLLREIMYNGVQINAVITHTAPSFCEYICIFQNKVVISDAALLWQFPRNYGRTFIKIREVLDKKGLTSYHAPICC